MGFLSDLMKMFSSAKKPGKGAGDNIDAEIASFEKKQKMKPIYDKYFDTYIDAYNEAERARKSGDGEGAMPLYQKAIEYVQKAQPPGEEFLPPAPFTAFAAMLYHMGQDDHALAVLDIYSDYEKRHGNKVDTGMKAFRKRLATGDFRRLRNKYNK